MFFLEIGMVRPGGTRENVPTQGPQWGAYGFLLLSDYLRIASTSNLYLCVIDLLHHHHSSSNKYRRSAKTTFASWLWKTPVDCCSAARTHTSQCVANTLTRYAIHRHRHHHHTNTQLNKLFIQYQANLVRLLMLLTTMIFEMKLDNGIYASCNEPQSPVYFGIWVGREKESHVFGLKAPWLGPLCKLFFFCLIKLHFKQVSLWGCTVRHSPPPPPSFSSSCRACFILNTYCRLSLVDGGWGAKYKGAHFHFQLFDEWKDSPRIVRHSYYSFIWWCSHARWSISYLMVWRTYALLTLYFFLFLLYVGGRVRSWEAGERRWCESVRPIAQQHCRPRWYVTFDLFHSPMIEYSVERDDQPLFAVDVELLIMLLLLLLLFLFFLCVVRLPSFWCRSSSSVFCVSWLSPFMKWKKKKDGELFVGTVADFSGMDPLIYREPLRTEQYDATNLNGMSNSIPFSLVYDDVHIF